MTGPRTDVGEAELLQQFPDIARMKVDAEPFGDNALEVDPTPAHHPVDLTIRAGLDDLRELSSCSAERRGLGPSVQLSIRLSGPEALKRWTQSRSVCRSIPPIFAAAPRSIPSLTAASDRSRRLWLTSFDRQASLRSFSAE
jgi:hypothetical protein